MKKIQLIAECGATKSEWVIIGSGSKPKSWETMGIHPFFTDTAAIKTLLRQKVVSEVEKYTLTHVHYYGAGVGDKQSVQTIQSAFKTVFREADIAIESDLLGAARGLCGSNKGVACILGTGSNSCYYNGKKIKNYGTSLGYILGDEGSGAFLGKKIVQYYLYNIFDEALAAAFATMYPKLTKEKVVEQTYRQPFANTYLASFAPFLSANRGHYMVENILEDAFNEFVFTHVCSLKESWKYPVHFTGSIADSFKDVLAMVVSNYPLELGNIQKRPLDGLIHWHNKD